MSLAQLGFEQIDFRVVTEEVLDADLQFEHRRAGPAEMEELMLRLLVEVKVEE